MGVVDKETRERMIREWQKQKEAMQEIEDMQKEVMKDYIQGLKIELEKKDKIIDEMSEYLASIDFDEHCVEVPGICIDCPKEDDLDGYMQCIKQYFERKVENGN